MFQIGTRFLLQDTDCPGLLDWIGWRAGVKEWGKARGFGLLDPDAGIIAGIAFNKYDRWDVMIHVAAIEKSRWMSKALLFAVFDYPFNTLGCHRITALVAKKNLSSRELVTRVGFTFEGMLREGEKGTGDDLLAYGMLLRECRWLAYGNKLKENNHAQDKAA